MWKEVTSLVPSQVERRRSGSEVVAALVLSKSQTDVWVDEEMARWESNEEYRKDDWHGV